MNAATFLPVKAKQGSVLPGEQTMSRWYVPPRGPQISKHPLFYLYHHTCIHGEAWTSLVQKDIVSREFMFLFLYLPHSMLSLSLTATSCPYSATVFCFFSSVSHSFACAFQKQSKLLTYLIYTPALTLNCYLCWLHYPLVILQLSFSERHFVKYSGDR